MSDDFKDRPFAQRGAKIERLGYLMQQPDTSIEDLIQAGLDAGLCIGFGIVADGRPVRNPEPEGQEDDTDS